MKSKHKKEVLSYLITAEEVTTFLMFLCEKNFEIESPEVEILISLDSDLSLWIKYSDSNLNLKMMCFSA